MLTSRHLAGGYYNGYYFQRCPSFNQCIACSCCTNRDMSAIQCVTCEGIKPGRNYMCNCSNKTRMNAVKIREKLKRPMFDPNAKHGDTTIREVAFDKDWDKLMKGMGVRDS